MIRNTDLTHLLQIAARLLSDIVSVTAPRRCLLCGECVRPDAALCSGCYLELPFIRESCARCAAILQTGEICGRCTSDPAPFDRAFAAFEYSFPVDHLVRRLKYNDDPAICRQLGGLMAEELLSRRSTPLPEVLVPVPLYPARVRERGYNQALEISRSLSGQTGVPVDTALLSRWKHTSPQVGKTRKERDRNLKSAFRLDYTPAYGHCAIVDDVITSGATMRSAAKTLREGGIAVIEVWCLARA